MEAKIAFCVERAAGRELWLRTLDRWPGSAVSNHEKGPMPVKCTLTIRGRSPDVLRKRMADVCQRGAGRSEFDQWERLAMVHGTTDGLGLAAGELRGL